MRIAFAPGFLRATAKLTPPQRRLLRQYWEVRVGLKLRIVFAIEGDMLTFTLVGSHDDVHRFLRRRPG